MEGKTYWEQRSRGMKASFSLIYQTYIIFVKMQRIFTSQMEASISRIGYFLAASGFRVGDTICCGQTSGAMDYWFPFVMF